MADVKPELQASYDCVAEYYAGEYFDELTRKPFDCELLNEFAESLRGQGSVCDLGSGPGHIARYLKDRGLQMQGIDLSAEMVNCANRLNPGIKFTQGDMRRLQFDNGSLAGIVSFYAIIHLHRERPRRL